MATRRFLSYLIGLAGAAFVFWVESVLVSPNFWASLSINPPWLIAVKIGAALLTFIILKAVSAPRERGGE